MINIKIDSFLFRENSVKQLTKSPSLIKKYREEYEEAMKLFENALNTKNQSVSNLSVYKLFKLKHTGEKIKELYNSQILARKSENINNGFQPICSLRNDSKETGLVGLIKNFFTRSNDNNGTESYEENLSYSVYKSRSRT
ncbi:hypothetical protein HHI36_016301 [Cryptolaemus montrouzieri]|uniref:Uncharacterized protein n=1 Tax=Cryptolaemus montrouzieri TaxID=559131 RepID=A0ABD2NJ98_9CUCU